VGRYQFNPVGKLVVAPGLCA